jgi:V8-like Glu-specific endopeptidase
MNVWKKSGLVLGVCGLAASMLTSVGTAQAPEGPQDPMPAPLPRNDPNARLDQGKSAIKAIPFPEGPSGKAAGAPMSAGFDLKTGRAAPPEAPGRAAPGVGSNSGGEQGSVTGFMAEPRQKTVLGADDRIKITNTTTYPWRTHCKLYMRFRGVDNRDYWYSGSGTLIGNKYVITAGHCVYNHDRVGGQKLGWAREIQAYPGLNGSYAPYGRANATYLRSWTGWVNNGDFNWDIALVTLNRTVGNSTGWLGYGSFGSLNGQTANLSGYPGNRDNGVGQYYHYGPVVSSSSHRVNYRVDTSPGQSGSGVYLIQGANRYVFAAHSTGGSTDNGGTRIESTKFWWLYNAIRSGI